MKHENIGTGEIGSEEERASDITLGPGKRAFGM